MKTIFVCDNCGSTHVFIDAYSAMNWEEVRTYDFCVCMKCEDFIRESWPKKVEVPDDTDVENYTHPTTREQS